ncbi:MAG: DUF2807 domain-containing protein [Clostridiales bacterium]|nr:DUF2807 domain-containing protein [Clostridiales bacterium]
MYNTDAMGVRIGELRRGKGLTQEAFAKKLGLSPQAVSKWETGLGYPDITLLPAIAETLGVPIELLFGAEAPQEAAVPDASAAPVPQDSPAEANLPDFPETEGADRLAHQWGDTACYASVPPERVSGSRVEFPDGSYADLSNGEIVNQGRIRIRLAYNEDGGGSGSAYTQATGTEHCCDSREGVHSLTVKTSGHVETRIHATNDGVCRWEASGSSRFMDSLTVAESNGRLKIENRQTENGRGFFGFRREQENRIEIWTGFSRGEEAELTIAGSGSIVCEPSFAAASLAVAGSGDIDFSEADTLTVSVAGSGDVDFAAANAATVSVAGSGDVDGGCVRESLSVNIAGSGDVSIRESRLRRFNASIAGSGDISVGALDAETAEIAIRGSGDVSVASGTAEHLTAGLSGSGTLSAGGVTADTADITLGGTSEMTLGGVRGKCVSRVARTASLRILHVAGSFA